MGRDALSRVKDVEQEQEQAVPMYKEVGLPKRFEQWVKERQRIHDEIESLQLAKTSLSEQILEALTESKVPSVGVGEWRVTRSEGRRGATRLDEKLLLGAGVTANVIAKCKVVGPQGAPYLVVTKQQEV